jgi:biotin carboxyl carrier protein
MEKYYVEINNEKYEVLVKSEAEAKANNTAGEAVEHTNNVEQVQPQQQQQTVQSSNQAAPPAAEDGNFVSVESPMSGSILSIEAAEGDEIAKDEVVIIIEAMKMETEIFAPVSGEIVDIKAVVGNHCKQGEELAVIKETGGN